MKIERRTRKPTLRGSSRNNIQNTELTGSSCVVVSRFKMCLTITKRFLMVSLWVAMMNDATMAHKGLPGKRIKHVNPPMKQPRSFEMSCDGYASCRSGVDHSETCFCDPLCSLFADCCPDHVDEADGRPQTPLPPGSFVCSIALKSIYVITSCPRSYGIQYVRNGCRRGSETQPHRTDEMFYAVPVSSRTSGLVYRNLYCALCHAEENFTFWAVEASRPSRPLSPRLDHKALETQSRDTENVDELLRRESFTFDFSRVADAPDPRRCVHSVSTCPPNSSDIDLTTRCLRSSNVAYVFGRNSLVYRNRDCATCNGVPDHDLDCKSTTFMARRTSIMKTFRSFAIILDLNTGSGSVSGARRGGPTATSQRLGSCEVGHVYDPFTGSCRAVTCPPGHSWSHDGECRRDLEDYDDDVDKLTQTIYRPLRSKVDDRGCAWIQLTESEYQLLSNRSIYLPLQGATYDHESYVVDANQTVFVCTSFQRNYTEWVHETLRVDAVGTYLSVVCSILSLLALAFQFAVYMSFPVLRNTPGRCVMSLVASLFVGQLLFLLVNTGTFFFWYCFCQAILMHYAFTAAFFWMNVMALDVYRTFASKSPLTTFASSPGARRRFFWYSVYAWLSSALVIGVALTTDLVEIGGEWRPHYGLQVCWFGSRQGLLVFFGVPVAVLLAANIIMFSLSVREIHSASKASQMAVQKTDHTQLLVIYVKLSVAMGLGWILGFIAAFTDWSPMWYVFIVINSLQGVLLCAAFVVTRQVSRLLSDAVRPLWHRASSTGFTPSSSAHVSSSLKPSRGESQCDDTGMTSLSEP